MELFAVNYAKGRIRYATLNGRRHIVAPLTMIVPGVLHGSQGPLLYTSSEIEKNPAAWNNMPLVVYHPVIDGRPVSARSAEILNRQGIGVVLNARINKGRLVAEGWFDIETTKRIDGSIIENLESGRPIELSTGVYTENEQAHLGATFNGAPFTHYARNLRPDHLAILPRQKGACSLNDGCGVLVNSGVSHGLLKKIQRRIIGHLRGDQSGSPVTTLNRGEPAMASKLTEKERKQAIQSLVANCDCYKPEDAEVLNKLSDDALTTLVENKEILVEVGDALGEELTANSFPEALDKMRAGLKKKAAPAEVEDEEEAVAPAANATLSALPASVQRSLKRLEAIENKQRTEIIGKMTANMEGPAKKQAIQRLAKKSLDDLEFDFAVFNTAKPEEFEAEGYALPTYNFQGAAGGPVRNQQEDDPNDILLPPTTNWQEWARQNDARTTAEV